MVVQEVVQSGDGGRAPKATTLDGPPETMKNRTTVVQKARKNASEVLMIEKIQVAGAQSYYKEFIFSASSSDAIRGT